MDTVSENQNIVTSLKHLHDWVEWVVFSPDENLLASCSADLVNIWKVGAKSLVTELLHPDTVWKCIFTHCSSKLLCGCSNGQLFVWTLTNFSTPYKVIEAHNAPIFGIAGHPYLDLVATSSQDCTIKLHDLARPSQKNLLLTFNGHSDVVEHVSFSPDGMSIASCSKDRTIQLRRLDAECHSCLSVLVGRGHTYWVYCCNFSTDGSLLVSGSADRTVRVWDPASMQCVHVLSGHTNIVWACHVLSLKGPVIVSCSSDRSLR